MCLAVHSRGRVFVMSRIGCDVAVAFQLKNQPCQYSVSSKNGVTASLPWANTSASLKQNQIPWMPSLHPRSGLDWLACEFVGYHTATLDETHFIELNLVLERPKGATIALRDFRVFVGICT